MKRILTGVVLVLAVAAAPLTLAPAASAGGCPIDDPFTVCDGDGIPSAGHTFTAPVKGNCPSGFILIKQTKTEKVTFRAKNGKTSLVTVRKGQKVCITG